MDPSRALPRLALTAVTLALAPLSAATAQLPAQWATTDLALSMEAAPDPVVAGGEITYALRVTNRAAGPAGPVTLLQTLPQGATLVSCVASTGACGDLGSAPSAWFPAIAGGATETATVVARVSPSVPHGAELASRASAWAGDLPDLYPADNFASASVTAANPFADLAVSQSASAERVAPGSELVYTLTASNRGPQPASSVTVTQELPAGISAVSCSATGSGTCAGGPTPLTVSFPELAAGGADTATVVARVDSAAMPGSLLIAVARVAAAAPADPDPSNNTAPSPASIVTAAVPRFGIFEAELQAARLPPNPYVGLSANATFVGPDGRTRTIPLFWDGGSTWKLRFSPDLEGPWTWTTVSADPGLNGRSGAFVCVASPARGGIRAMAGAPHHFERQDGTPFWWMGDTHWILFSDLLRERMDRAAALAYVDLRAAQGFNVVHAALLTERFAQQNAGGRPFTNVAAETLDPAFWREVDLRLAHLNARGITAGLVLSWGTRWRDFASNEARLRYAAYAVARYSAYNVFFLVANEWGDGLTRDQVRAIGARVAADDPHDRLVGTHGIGSVQEFAGDSWAGFGDYQQLYTALHTRVLDARRHGKPVVNAEHAYYLRDRNGNGVVDKNNSFSVGDVRHAAWDIAMAGGYVVTGFGTTYYGGHRDPAPFNPLDPRNRDWEEDAGHLRALFTAPGLLEWWKLQPASTLLTSAVRRGRDVGVTNADGRFVRPPVRAFWALAEPGRQYVAYVRGYAGPHQLSLGGVPSASYTVLLYDPRSGAFTQLGAYTGAGPLTLTPPDDRDWIYVLRAPAVAPPSPP